METPTTPQTALGRKQRANNDHFLDVSRNIESYVSRQRAEVLVSAAVSDIQQKTHGKKVAYSWSGGKDSIALQVVCEVAGIKNCVLAMNRLEYPAFLAWVTNNMPSGLEVINTEQDLEWLAGNLHMLFPQTAEIAAKWFSIVQHRAQHQYYFKHSLDVIILGRRRADGNFVGRNGSNIYESKGVTRFSPICDWTHEEVMAVNHYYRMPIPPVYSWPNGFVVGTGCWAARQYTRSIENGWREVFSIDPKVVEFAATKIASAREFLRSGSTS